MTGAPVYRSIYSCGDISLGKEPYIPSDILLSGVGNCLHWYRICFNFQLQETKRETATETNTHMVKPEHPRLTRVKPEEESQSTQLTPHILVIDDEELICQQLYHLYSYSGFRVTVVTSAEQALEVLARADTDLVVTDIRLSGLSGIALTERIQESWPEVPVIAISGHADIGAAVNVLKSGASDYILKPFSAATILESTRLLLKKAEIFTEIRHLRQTLKEKCEFGGMLSTRPEMHRVFEIIRLVSNTDATVVVEGETGTGKELVARAVHELSDRARKPFVPINCSAVPEALLESELFGHMKGSFTGAIATKRGLFEEAHGGTLFLDEISALSPAIQVKLLRVLQERKIQRIGGNQEIPIDFRLVAATNVALEAEVKAGRFREDLFYRLNVFPIPVPPLRDRKQDIPLLANHFRLRFADENGIEPPEILPETLQRMVAYDWPGNVRELENFIERGVIMYGGSRALRFEAPMADRGRTERDLMSKARDERWTMDRLEREYIFTMLEEMRGHQGRVSEILGVNRRTLYRKLQRYRKEGLRPPVEPVGAGE
jgi:two-component system, NtrC family, response regulator AtoC